MKYPYTLPPLPYSYDALEPYIDKMTMEIHHTKHHQGYINNLNSALEKYPDWQDVELEEILKNLNQLPEEIRTTVRNNGGGHYNHSLFWEIMKPATHTEHGQDTNIIHGQIHGQDTDETQTIHGQDTDRMDKNQISERFVSSPNNSVSSELSVSSPNKSVLLKAIEDTFGSFENFKNLFSDVALKHFGSGWAWLVLTPEKKLKVYSLPNQDNPLMNGDLPIMGLDVWEHAYYLKYQNRRNEYIQNWWNVVNWDKIEENYKKALSK